MSDRWDDLRRKVQIGRALHAATIAWPFRDAAALLAERDALAAENERLRALLAEVVDGAEHRIPLTSGSQLVREIRAALTPPGEADRD